MHVRYGACVAGRLQEMTAAVPLLQAAAKLASSETKRVLKRLHLPADSRQRKDYCKPHARMLAKISVSNPLPIMETIVATVSPPSHTHSPPPSQPACMDGACIFAYKDRVQGVRALISLGA